MKAALRIVRKDARRFWPFVLALLALHLAFAVMEIELVLRPQGWRHLADMLKAAQGVIPLAWMFVIGLVVTEDPPSGENSFWLTRPCTRGSLFAGKLLAVLLFVNVPWLIGDCVILGAVGLPLDVGHLVLRQLPLCAMVILPAFLLAAAGRTLGGFALLVMGAVLAFVAALLVTEFWHHDWMPEPNGHDFFWLLACEVAMLALIGHQYQKSRTAVFRVVAVVSAGIPFFVLASFGFFRSNGAFYVPWFGTHPKSAVDWARVHVEVQPADETAKHGCAIPVKVSGLPAGYDVEGAGRANGVPGNLMVSLVRLSESGAYLLYLEPQSGDVNGVFDLQGELRVVALGPEQTAKIDRRAGRVPIAGFGMCIVGGGDFDRCWSGPVHAPGGVGKGGEHGFNAMYGLYGSDGDTGTGEPLNWKLWPVEGDFEMPRSGTVEWRWRAAEVETGSVWWKAERYRVKDCKPLDNVFLN